MSSNETCNHERSEHLPRRCWKCGADLTGAMLPGFDVKTQLEGTINKQEGTIKRLIAENQKLQQELDRIKNPHGVDGTLLYSITLRDLFAGFAVAGMFAGPAYSEWGPHEAAHHAIKVADAMLEARRGG